MLKWYEVPVDDPIEYNTRKGCHKTLRNIDDKTKRGQLQMNGRRDNSLHNNAIKGHAHTHTMPNQPNTIYSSAFFVPLSARQMMSTHFIFIHKNDRQFQRSDNQQPNHFYLRWASITFKILGNCFRWPAVTWNGNHRLLFKLHIPAVRRWYNFDESSAHSTLFLCILFFVFLYLN